MRNNEIQELITQLNRLQLQQAELFTRLERAINTKAARREEENVTNNKEYYRENVANDTEAARRAQNRENVTNVEAARRAQNRENVTKP
jgi:hypothetical protein